MWINLSRFCTLMMLLLQIVRDAETLAQRMNHRGACACDNDTGDGAGVLTAIPHALYSSELRSLHNPLHSVASLFKR